MLQRKIEATIEAHLKSNSKKILLVDGARQVGKTYIIRYVGQSQSISLVFSNSEKSSSFSAPVYFTQDMP